MTNRLIAFEGVDGAGKSTAIAIVAQQLRARGERVFMPRSGKDHASRPVRQIREVTRDRRNVALDAHAELLLYCAREAQVLAELVRPALQRGETVLLDRSLLTAEVLGRARGLSAESCAQAVRVAAAGLSPDMTLVFDVHPRTGRVRKQLERVRSHNEERGGRKGLAGSAFKERVRDLYQALAGERGYAVLHAERATPVQLAHRALGVVDTGASAVRDETVLDRIPQWLVAPELNLQQALASLPRNVALHFSAGLAAGRALRQQAYRDEPALCAFGLDAEDPLREELAMLEPAYALRGLGGRPLEGPRDLRLRLLERAPAACLQALWHLSDPESDRIREQALDVCPDDVLARLAGREDAAGLALRERCLASASDRALSLGLRRCTDTRAWQLREQLFDRDPVYGLRSLRGVSGERAQAWLESFAESAPSAVLDALSGRSDDAAYRLRDALYETGREVIDSVRGLGDERAWALRERAAIQWPSTVAHSLLHLPADSRVREMTERCARLGAGDVHTLRRLEALREQPAATQTYTRRNHVSMEMER